MSGSIDVTRPKDELRGPGFAASIDAWSLGGIGLVSMVMPGAGYTRIWDHSPRAEADHWSLMIPVADGSGSVYGQRPIAFGSLATPFRGSGTDTKVVSLFLPRDLFRGASGDFDMMLGPQADRGRVALLADFVVSLERRLGEDASGVDVRALSAAICAITKAALALTPDGIEEARTLLNARLTARIVSRIRAQLTDPDLGWEGLCRDFGLSRSTLHRLFEPYGGVATFVRDERLKAAERSLVDGRGTIAVGSVAERFGFGDPSSFSRAFRRAFGYAPREVGQTALVGPVPAAGRGMPPLDSFLFGLR